MLKLHENIDGHTEDAHSHAYRTSPAEFDISNWNLFKNDTIWPYFERMRKECPICFHPESRYGPFWSITKYADIMKVDTNHKVFSSARGIAIADEREGFEMPMFIAMDPPKHERQRKVVAPVVAPQNLSKMEATIRRRVAAILDSLPVEEEFNWVEKVSIELTTQMLATLLGYPFDERYQLTRWSDVGTSGPQSGVVESHEQRQRELMECLDRFTRIREERRHNPSGHDMISLLARDPRTRDMPPMEYLGNLMLLIVGGNDTTRNSISGGVLALNLFPDQYRKLHENPSLISNMVPEIIRWQTPLTHMRRHALEDFTLGGKRIREGDRVIMWYISGNRDEEVFANASDLIIDRPNARRHLSFGYGIHRCMGNRLAEMQLRVLWEEIMQRFEWIEVTSPPVRNLSNFVHGFTRMSVRIHPRKKAS